MIDVLQRQRRLKLLRKLRRARTVSAANSLVCAYRLHQDRSYLSSAVLRPFIQKLIADGVLPYPDISFELLFPSPLMVVDEAHDVMPSIDYICEKLNVPRRVLGDSHADQALRGGADAPEAGEA